MKPPDVGDDEYALIRRKAEEEWPDDFEMQAHVVGEQIEALRELRHGCPADIDQHDFEVVRRKAALEWPDDFQMRLHVEKEQCDALRRLGRVASPVTSPEVRTGSESNDPPHELRSGCPADIDERDFEVVRRKAALDWPDDFQMRIHVEKEQCDALRLLGRVVTPGAPRPVTTPAEMKKPESNDGCPANGCVSVLIIVSVLGTPAAFVLLGRWL